MAISLFIRKGAKRPFVNLSCRIYYSKDGKVLVNLTLSTKIAVNRVAWETAHNGTAKNLKEWTQSEEGERINKIESAIRTAVDDYVENIKGHDTGRIKRIVENIISPSREEIPATLVAYAERYLEQCKNGTQLVESGHNKGQVKSRNTLAAMQCAINALKSFEEANNTEITFADVNDTFVGDLKKFLTARGLKANSLRQYFRVFHAILHTAEKYDLIDLRRVDVSAPKEETFAVYLSQEKLDTLFNGDFGERLNEVRDTFLLGCETGQRYSDYSRLSMADVVTNDEGEFIKVKQQKTGALVFIPMTARAKAILSRKSTRRLSICNFNNYLRDLCKAAGFTEDVEITSKQGLLERSKQVPFYELVSSHTARRTLATLMFKAHAPLQDIMAITGHKTEATLRNYLRMTEEEIGRNVAKSAYFVAKRFAV